MDNNSEIAQLKREIAELRQMVVALQSPAQLAPDVRRTFEYSLVKLSSALPSNYDKSVNEAGASTYNVADVFDGFFELQGRLVGYYDV